MSPSPRLMEHQAPARSATCEAGRTATKARPPLSTILSIYLSIYLARTDCPLGMYGTRDPESASTDGGRRGTRSSFGGGEPGAGATDPSPPHQTTP
eukprot:scaffold1141_cov369-Prasinococcus_capsulatus_cf.AAC.13